MIGMQFELRPLLSKFRNFWFTVFVCQKIKQTKDSSFLNENSTYVVFRVGYLLSRLYKSVQVWYRSFSHRGSSQRCWFLQLCLWLSLSKQNRTCNPIVMQLYSFVPSVMIDCECVILLLNSLSKFCHEKIFPDGLQSLSTVQGLTISFRSDPILCYSGRVHDWSC